ncbi:hypothetical protein HK405_009130, partial [Cladochytrium tenue]
MASSALRSLLGGAASYLSSSPPQPPPASLENPADHDGVARDDHPVAAAAALKARAAAEAAAAAGYCVDCEDQPATLFCEACGDPFCQVCFEAIHHRGTRRLHNVRPLQPPPQSTSLSTAAAATAEKGAVTPQLASASGDSYHAVPNGVEDGVLDASPADAMEITEDDVEPVAPLGDVFVERAKYIPVRLTLDERKFLRLLEAALNVSEYTDKVDILTYGSKTRRQVAQIQELCSIISGLVLAADYKAGQELFKEKSFEENGRFFRRVFELGRRHKIMNPEKMRSTYGKLIYLLQDAQAPEVQHILQFSCVSEIKTVYSVLDVAGGLDLLRDPLVAVATKDIIADGKKREEIQADVDRKEQAIEVLSVKYARDELSSDDIKLCLHSIGDNHAFLRANRDPCEKMIAYLKKYFSPDQPEKGKFSLAIQGLNRVQAAPKTARLMHSILHRAQQQVGYWVGSSVIHMGDINVPNALMFIDKYTQIFRILLPIVRCLDSLDALAASGPSMAAYLDSAFGGADELRRTVLADFFRHGFDGSGADNFFSAGSCIDGRLTSAWNWCANIEKKPFFHVFLLTGFVGFDGEWG